MKIVAAEIAAAEFVTTEIAAIEMEIAGVMVSRNEN